MPTYKVDIVGPDGGKGSITVNASDPQSAMENAQQGGNTPMGSPAQVDAGPNAQTSSINYTSGSNSGGVYNTNVANNNSAAPKGNATTGQTQGDPGSAFGYNGGQSGTTAADRTKSIYEGRDNESLQQWMQRIFRQGTRDFGGTLSPDASNPYGRTPYANWFQNRYQDVVPANLALQRLLTNSGQTQDFGPDMEAGMKGFQTTGAGRGFGTGSQGAEENLGKLNDLLNDFAQQKTGGLSNDQVTMLGSLMDSPQQANALVNAQLAGGAGANPFASGYIQSLESRMMNDYFDNPVDQDPAKNGTYLNNLMTRLNLRRPG